MFKFEKLAAAQRAVGPISSNIAEGSARSDRDRARFIDCATASFYAVTTQATIVRGHGYLSNDTVASPYQEGAEISRVLAALAAPLNDRGSQL